MEDRDGLYTAIAELLAYPDGGFRGGGSLPSCPSTRRPLRLAEFDAAACGCDPADLEELYTRTFDFSPSCGTGARLALVRRGL